MTQIKILVNNIQDVTHRAAAETELNVYLKTGWKVHETHQHMDIDNGTLMLTTIITKEEDKKTESSTQEAVKPKENSVTKTDQQNIVEEHTSEKEETKEETSETPKGFKIKEKKVDAESSEEEKGAKEAEENTSDEGSEEKTS